MENLKDYRIEQEGASAPIVVFYKGERLGVFPSTEEALAWCERHRSGFRGYVATHGGAAIACHKA